MENTNDDKITLKGVLDYLQLPYPSNQDAPFLFINPGGNLETFFTYKGCLIEINKYSIELLMKKKTTEEIGEEIRQKIMIGLKSGDWIVFSTGSSIMSIKEFLIQFKFFSDDFLNNSKIMDKKFILTQNILKKEEDIDFNGNKGFYRVNENAKIVYLSTINLKDLDDFRIKNKSNDSSFRYIIVE